MKLKNNRFFDTLKVERYTNLLPDLKQEKTQQITALVLTLIALSFFGLFAINPTLSTIAKLKKEIIDNKFVDTQLQQKITNISILQQNYSNIENDLNFVTDAVPLTAEPALLMADLQALGQRENISLSNIQISEVEVAKKTEGTNNYNSFNFTFSVQGSLENVLSFISGLTKMQRSISLESISLSQGGIQGRDFEAGINGTAYFKN
jgi:Tfp pilus assembly protein PilO